MDDALVVRGLEGVGHLACQPQRLGDWNRPRGDPLGKRVAFDQFEDEELSTVDLFKSVDGGNVRVVEGREDLRLTLEPGDPFGVAREPIG